jgi:hypothetical protein
MHGQTTVLSNGPRATDFVPSTINGELALEDQRKQHSRLCQKGMRLDLACHAADECMGCGMRATKRVVVVVSCAWRSHHLCWEWLTLRFSVRIDSQNASVLLRPPPIPRPPRPPPPPPPPLPDPPVRPMAPVSRHSRERGVCDEVS